MSLEEAITANTMAIRELITYIKLNNPSHTSAVKADPTPEPAPRKEKAVTTPKEDAEMKPAKKGMFKPAPEKVEVKDVVVENTPSKLQYIDVATVTKNLVVIDKQLGVDLLAEFGVVHANKLPEKDWAAYVEKAHVILAKEKAKESEDLA